MRQPTVTGRSEQTKRRSSLGTFDRLEERALLAPVLGGFGGTFMTPTVAGNTVTITLGFVSTRLVSSQTGRLEVDPTGAFGNDLFIISRGTPVGGGGLVPIPVNPGDVAGRIYRVDPYAVDGIGTMTAGQNREAFATIPGGGTSFGGYENWFDLAFDPTGTFNGVDGGPTLFVSTLDSATTAGINPRNAIYGFRPDGSLVTPITALNPTGTFAFSNLDAVHPGIHDSQVGAIAVAPGDTFGRDLFALDVACDNPPGVTCAAGDGNTIFHVSPLQPQPVNLDQAPTPLNQHVEGTLPPLTPPPANNDIDVRAMQFDPQRGIILQGQFGEPAFQRFGGLFVASSDIEPTDTFVSRIIQFPNPGATPVDLIPPTPVNQLLIGDMAFDPVGYFGGGIFFTDYVTGSVNQLLVDPVTGLSIVLPFASNFNVQSPTQFLPTDPPGVTPAEAYRDAFSISFSHDGEIMFVSDRDGVWGFYANTLAHTPAGTMIGLNDIRELHAPYTGDGLAAAVIDSGVDGAHLGFQGTVSAGFSPSIPGPANFDFTGHGTSVAGIIHQIVPDAVIEPINLLYGLTNSFFLNNSLYKAATYLKDHSTVDDPRTAAFDPVPIVAANMSIGIRSGPEENLVSDAWAVHEAPSVAIPLKATFAQYPSLNGGMGIVPVASAGNSGELMNGVTGADIPGILNEVVQVAAAYPYNASLDQGLPTGPPIGPDGNGGFVRCQLEAGDLTAFVGKITAFSNRSVTTDYAAPGTCVSTFTPSFFTGQFGSQFAFASAVVPAPLEPTFNGTSAAAPMVTGQFVFGYDVVQEWVKILARGGVISPSDPDKGVRELNQYLTRDLGFTTTISVGDAIPALNEYLNSNGINSILEWSARPFEDINAGESFATPNGLDDDVAQRRLIDSSRFRTYGEPSVANFLSSVEGTIALNYFIAHPAELTALDNATPFSPGVITASDLDAYVADVTKTANSRAMARMLGGSDRIARLNRLAYLDIVQDGQQNGGIQVSSIDVLVSKLLPRPDAFVITSRGASAEQPFALDPTALRNYHDLKFMPDMVVKLGKKWAKKSPDQFRLGVGAGAHFKFLPHPEVDLDTPIVGKIPDYKVTGRAGDRGSMLPPPGQLPPPGFPGDPGGGDNGGGGGDTGGGTADPSQPDNVAAVGDSGSDYVYHTDSTGNLLESSQNADGSWSVNNLTSATHGPKIQSEVTAMDLSGAGHRAVFGLNNGHVIRYEFLAGSWISSDVTADAGLIAVESSLTAMVSGASSAQSVLLYGLNASGELIEYAFRNQIWSSRNVTAIAHGARLESGLVAFAQASSKKGKESITVFGVSADHRLIQYTWSGKRWTQMDLSTFSNAPAIMPHSLALLPSNSVTGGLSLFALDDQGSLWRYRGNIRLGWEVITGVTDGPALIGELAVQYDAPTGQIHVYGKDADGRLIEYSGSPGNWSWSVVATPDPAAAGDLGASDGGHSVYAELVDGALAEFWYDGIWNMRRIWGS